VPHISDRSRAIAYDRFPAMVDPVETELGSKYDNYGDLLFREAEYVVPGVCMLHARASRSPTPALRRRLLRQAREAEVEQVRAELLAKKQLDEEREVRAAQRARAHSALLTAARVLRVRRRPLGQPSAMRRASWRRATTRTSSTGCTGAQRRRAAAATTRCRVRVAHRACRAICRAAQARAAVRLCARAFELVVLMWRCSGWRAAGGRRPRPERRAGAARNPGRNAHNRPGRIAHARAGRGSAVVGRQDALARKRDEEPVHREAARRPEPRWRDGLASATATASKAAERLAGGRGGLACTPASPAAHCVTREGHEQGCGQRSGRRQRRRGRAPAVGRLARRVARGRLACRSRCGTRR
jgi:hypothetical protein